jgi:hypothetical protein
VHGTVPDDLTRGRLAWSDVIYCVRNMLT